MESWTEDQKRTAEEVRRIFKEAMPRNLAFRRQLTLAICTNLHPAGRSRLNRISAGTLECICRQRCRVIQGDMSGSMTYRELENHLQNPWVKAYFSGGSSADQLLFLTSHCLMSPYIVSTSRAIEE